jgi:UDP-GlcNAc3NAcA epimerase
MSRHIMTVVGARPQFIKAAVLSRAFSKIPGLSESLVHTGQHYDSDMSQRFFDELHIPPPKFNLGIHGKGHGEMTGMMLEALEKVFCQEKPDLVLVYGDTNSTLAGALAAAKLHIPVAHVEAGLRSFNRRMPEEINRVLTDHLSDLLFAPTRAAVVNLENENIRTPKVNFVGDVMFDSVKFFHGRLQPSREIADLADGHEFAVMTLHRAENTDNPEQFKEWIAAAKEVARDRKVYFPMHPRTAALADQLDWDLAPLSVLPPVGYQDMLYLLSHCSLAMTDSGGLQKEAYFLGVPCLTLRTETEWTELVALGANHIVGADPKPLPAMAKKYWGQRFQPEAGPYGRGDAGEQIIKVLADFLI